MKVSGTVRSSYDGSPVEGVLVMGADLNYAETDSRGRFTLHRPEMVLFFWCPGFFPAVHPLTAGGEQRVDVVMRRIAAVRTSA